MNKLLLFGVLLGIIAGFSGVAVAQNQGTIVIIGENIQVAIDPVLVNFGTVAPGSNNIPATTGNIILNAAGSNADLTVTVTDVTGFPFEAGLLFGGTPAEGQSFIMDCTINGGVCQYDILTIVPTLNVPPGAAQSTQQGTIVYTITGSPP